MHKSFLIIFEIYPTADDPSDEWTSLLHFTKGGNKYEVGDRTPAIFFRPGTTAIFFGYAKNGSPNAYCHSEPLPVERWSMIQFSQYEEDGKFYIKILLNGKSLEDCPSVVENKKPYAFLDQKVESQIFHFHL